MVRKKEDGNSEATGFSDNFGASEMKIRKNKDGFIELISNGVVINNTNTIIEILNNILKGVYTPEGEEK